MVDPTGGRDGLQRFLDVVMFRYNAANGDAADPAPALWEW